MLWGIILGVILLICVVCIGVGKSVQMIKTNKKKEKERRFWEEIPDTDFYARLNNELFGKECQKVYTQEDLH